MEFGFLKKQQTVEQIPVAEIRPNPFQPRKTMDDGELLHLGESIRENGLIQPITVRRTKGGYELVAGERRLRACRLIGKETVSAIVCELSDEGSAAWALIENLQRSDLGVFDEAEGLARLLLLWDLPQEAAAKRLGVAPSTLSNKLRLLKLSPKVREEIERTGLSEHHARELLRLPDEETRLAALRVMEKRRLSAAETEKYITSLLEAGKPKNPKTVYIVKDVRLFLNTFEHALSVMNEAGIGAVSTVSESEDSLVYTVCIPKSTAFHRKGEGGHPKTAPAYSACAPSVI